MKDITVSFPGGKKVAAHFNGHTVQTDQPAAEDRMGTRGIAPRVPSTPPDMRFSASGG